MFRRLFAMVFIAVFLFAGSVSCAEFQLPASYDVNVDVTFTNDKDVAVLHMTLDVLPASIELLVPGFSFDINTANKQFIMFSYTKQKSIPSGPILRLKYTNLTDNTAFTLKTLSATDINATKLIPIAPVSGTIKLYYTTGDVDKTEKNVIALGTGGIDYDKNNVFDALDVQNVVNGQK